MVKAASGLLFKEDARLASRSELSAFLEGVEKRAFRQVMYTLRNEETALDVVQDAMLKLSVSYGDRPCTEFPMLFQRILRNATHDVLRRQKVRNMWVTLFSALFKDPDEDDPLDRLMSDASRTETNTPHGEYERSSVMQAIEREIARLPQRQREAFVMRYWEEMDIAETAAAMGCSEGSVKTHCSRATQTLAAALKAKGIVL